MRKIYVLGLLGLCLFLVGCYSGDDDNRNIQLVIQDALIIENTGNYVVGDTLFIELNFSRFLQEEGFDTLLDVYESTGSEAFRYFFGLSKFSDFSDNFEPVNVAPDFLFSEKGRVNGSNDILVILNDTRERYESRIGLILTEEGDFRFDFGFLPIFSNEFKEDKVFIDITHRFSESTPLLEFKVTQ